MALQEAYLRDGIQGAKISFQVTAENNIAELTQRLSGLLEEYRLVRDIEFKDQLLGKHKSRNDAVLEPLYLL